MRAHRLRHICDRCILGGVDPAAGECKPVNFCVLGPRMWQQAARRVSEEGEEGEEEEF